MALKQSHNLYTLKQTVSTALCWCLKVLCFPSENFLKEVVFQKLASCLPRQNVWMPKMPFLTHLMPRHAD